MRSPGTDRDGCCWPWCSSPRSSASCGPGRVSPPSSGRSASSACPTAGPCPLPASRWSPRPPWWCCSPSPGPCPSGWCSPSGCSVCSPPRSWGRCVGVPGRPAAAFRRRRRAGRAPARRAQPRPRRSGAARPVRLGQRHRAAAVRVGRPGRRWCGGSPRRSGGPARRPGRPVRPHVVAAVPSGRSALTPVRIPAPRRSPHGAVDRRRCPRRRSRPAQPGPAARCGPVGCASTPTCSATSRANHRR